MCLCCDVNDISKHPHLVLAEVRLALQACLTYTLLQKKHKFLEVAFLFGKIVCHWTWDHTGYSQDHLTNSSKPYIRVSDPRAPGKMDRLNCVSFGEECSNRLPIFNCVFRVCMLGRSMHTKPHYYSMLHLRMCWWVTAIFGRKWLLSLLFDNSKLNCYQNRYSTTLLYASRPFYTAKN